MVRRLRKCFSTSTWPVVVPERADVPASAWCLKNSYQLHVSSVVGSLTGIPGTRRSARCGNDVLFGVNITKPARNSKLAVHSRRTRSENRVYRWRVSIAVILDERKFRYSGVAIYHLMSRTLDRLRIKVHLSRGRSYCAISWQLSHDNATYSVHESVTSLWRYWRKEEGEIAATMIVAIQFEARIFFARDIHDSLFMPFNSIRQINLYKRAYSHLC